MKINVDTVMASIDGQPLKGPDGKSDATLKNISVVALMTMFDQDKAMQGDEKLRLYEMATKINAGGEIELAPEDVVLLKKRIGFAYGPAVVGPAYKLLNG